MKKSLILVFSILLLAGENLVAQYNVTMMSYNIRGHAITSAKLDDIAKVINNYQPDVVAVQEVNLRPYFIKHDYLKELAEATGMNYEFLPTVGNYYGIGLLSRKQPLSIQSKVIPFSDSNKDKEDRGMIIAEYDDFYFISTHYSLNADDRDTATDYILDFTNKVSKTVFVAGDFNAQPTYRAMVTFKNYGYVILNDTRVCTYPSDQPDKCIDMVIGYNSIPGFMRYRVIGKGIAETPEVDLSTVSDHLPLYVKIRSLATGIEEANSDKVKVVKEGNILKIKGMDYPGQLAMYNSIGQPVLQRKVNGRECVVSLAGLSSGIYIITIKSESSNISMKYRINN